MPYQCLPAQSDSGDEGERARLLIPSLQSPGVSVALKGVIVERAGKNPVLLVSRKTGDGKTRARRRFPGSSTTASPSAIRTFQKGSVPASVTTSSGATASKVLPSGSIASFARRAGHRQQQGQQHTAVRKTKAGGHGRTPVREKF